MTSGDVSATRPPMRMIGLVRATLLAFAAVIISNAIDLASTELPSQGYSLRGLHHLYDAGRHLAAALLVMGIIWACGRVPALRGRGGYLVLGGASLLVGAFTLVEDASGFAGTLLPTAPQVALWALVVAIAGSVVAAAFVGHFLGGRGQWRWTAVAAGVAGLLIHPRVLESGYPAAHLYVAASCVALIATALRRAPLPTWWPRLQQALPWGATALVAAFSLAVPPTNSLLLQLLRQEADVVTPYVARLGVLGDRREVVLPSEWEPWFRDRSDVAPIPPTRPALAPDDAIVILLTIDSLRADVLEGRSAKKFPNLNALRRRGVYFENARTPGSETVTTLGALFMGTYYSQQYWSEHEGIRGLWPDDDDSIRFPQLLTDAGVATVNYGTARWLVNEYGISRGFSEETYVEPAKTHFSLTTETFPQLFERLAQHESGPLFVYSHILDAHHSCRPVKKGKGKNRYLVNLQQVDKQIGMLVDEIERLGLSNRTYLIISADHGEAFGEHGMSSHKLTLYEELLRVPLLIAGPNIKRRTVAAPVGVIDIGPTVLDLFGQATPGHFMGQSLVPLLRGKKSELTRPLLAEGLLKKALLFPDQTKVIVDDRNYTSEVYDLGSDPGEESNLVDVSSSKISDRIAVLRRFFDVHTLKRDGYTPPYRS